MLNEMTFETPAPSKADNPQMDRICEDCGAPYWGVHRFWC